MTEQDQTIIKMIRQNMFLQLQKFIEANNIAEPFNFVVKEDKVYTPLRLAKSHEMLQWILLNFNFDSQLRYFEDNLNIEPALNADIETQSIIAILEKATELYTQQKNIELLVNKFYMNRVIAKLPKKESISSNDVKLFEALDLFFSFLNLDVKDKTWILLEERFYQQYFAVLQSGLNIHVIRSLLMETENPRLAKMGFSYFAKITLDPSSIVLNELMLNSYEEELSILDQADESSDEDLQDENMIIEDNDAMSQSDESSDEDNKIYIDYKEALEDYRLREYIIERVRGKAIGGSAAERELQLKVPFIIIQDILLDNNHERKKIIVWAQQINEVIFSSIEYGVSNLSLKSLLSYYFTTGILFPTIKQNHQVVPDSHRNLLLAHSYFILIHYFIFKGQSKRSSDIIYPIKDLSIPGPIINALRQNSFSGLQNYTACLEPGDPINDFLKSIVAMDPEIFMERRNEYIKFLEEKGASKTISESQKILATKVLSLMQCAANYSDNNSITDNDHYSVHRFNPYQ